MRVLVVTDFHGQEPALDALASAVARLRPEALFCLGDLTERVWNAESYTHRFLEVVGVGARPVLCVAGNNDRLESLGILRAQGALLEDEERRLGDLRVVGRAYRWPAELWPQGVEGAVLLTHLPPPRGSSRGPRFHFAGHFHSRASVRRVDDTTVVSVPAALNGRGALLHWPEGRVEFIELSEDWAERSETL